MDKKKDTNKIQLIENIKSKLKNKRKPKYLKFGKNNHTLLK